VQLPVAALVHGNDVQKIVLRQ